MQRYPNDCVHEEKRKHQRRVKKKQKIHTHKYQFQFQFLRIRIVHSMREPLVLIMINLSLFAHIHYTFNHIAPKILQLPTNNGCLMLFYCCIICIYCEANYADNDQQQMIFSLNKRIKLDSKEYFLLTTQ